MRFRLPAFPKYHRFLECPLMPQSPPLNSGAPMHEVGQLFAFDSGLISTSWPAFNRAIQRIEEACHRAFPMKLSNPQYVRARTDRRVIQQGAQSYVCVGSIAHA